MAAHRLVFPGWHPPRHNEFRGRHWSAEHRAKKAAAELLAAEALRQAVPKAAGRRRVRLRIVLGPRDRRPDADAFDKALLDALVRAGLLLDDGARGLAGRLAVSFTRGPARRTEIALEDLAARAGPA